VKDYLKCKVLLILCSLLLLFSFHLIQSSIFSLLWFKSYLGYLSLIWFTYHPHIHQYGFAVNFVASWNDFTRLFLRRYFPNVKIVKLINQFVQLDRESFWKNFDRFKNLLAQCPHHGLDQACWCQIIYEELDQQTRTLVESMCQGDFLSKRATAGKEFLEDLAEKTI